MHRPRRDLAAARSGTAASAGTTLMPSPARTMPITVASWSTSITVSIACGRKRGVEVLAHAARARQVDEGPGRQVAQPDRRAPLRQRMVGAADEMEVVAAEQLGAQLGRLGAHRRRARSRPARRAPARCRARTARRRPRARCPDAARGSAPAPPAASRRPATAAARSRRGRGAAPRGRACRRRALSNSAQQRAAPGLRTSAPSAVSATWRVLRSNRRTPSAVLERADQRAERRLRQVHRRRGAREVALLRRARRRRAAGGVEAAIDLHFRSIDPNFRFHG